MQVTQLLSKIDSGDRQAADQLLPLVYDELRNLAKAKMANESTGQTLQATALVHEAFLRLVDKNDDQAWNSRGHFFAAAAESMRRILVDRARRKKRPKHGGDHKRVHIELPNIVDADNYEFLDELDKSICSLAEENAQAAEVVNLRFFGGLSIEDTADSLGISVRTVNRHWTFAKAWIYQQMTN